MANWQWILFWILVSTPFALNLRRALRARARNHRSLLKKNLWLTGATRKSGSGNPLIWAPPI